MTGDMQNLQVEPMAGDDASVLGDGYGHAPEPVASPLKTAHRLLEGRYVYAILLGLLGATVFGALGYLIPVPLYRSTGAIRFRPVLQRVLYESEESGVMPMFDAYVNEQADLMQRQRILDMAMSDDAWKRLGRKMTPEDQEEFRESLLVMHPKNSTIVTVSFRDNDPLAAQVAVKAVVDAYMKIYGGNDEIGEADRLRILEQRRGSLTGRIASLRQRILSIANEFGSDALEQMYAYKVEQLNNVETELVGVVMDLAAAGVSAASGAQVEQVEVGQMTIEQMAAQDQRIRSLVEQRGQMVEAYQVMVYRYGENYLRAKRAKEDLEVAAAVVDRAAQQIRSGAIPIGETNKRERGTSMSVVQLRDRQVHLQELYDQTKEEMLDLGRKKLQIDNLRLEMESVQKRLMDTKFRIEQLGIESMRSGRIDVVSRGDRPIVPDKDLRIPISIVACVGGLMLGVGSVMVVGVFGTRVRSSEEACGAAAHIRLLGVLPNLPDDLSDPAQIAVAGYGVHHIRTLLQLRAGSNGRQVFAVAGSASGTGKTSLTLALGISFAASGAKTLLIDFDMAGGGLSSRLEAILRRRSGEALLDAGLINKEQLENALRVADTQRIQLTAALVEQGVLTEEQLSGALVLPERAVGGLLKVLAGGDVDAYTVDTGIEGLHILPAGGAQAHDMSRVSPGSVARVIEQARDSYDVVLIDTGPIPGSVEAPIVAARADGVVLVVSQGDRRPQIQGAFDLLSTIGAHLEGVVYNRAGVREIAKSNCSASLSLSVGGGSRSVYSSDAYEQVWTDPSTSLRQACYGPVGRAVITSGQPAISDQEPKDV